MASDEVRLHGVTVGRVIVEMGGSGHGPDKTVRASLKFKPDHIGIMHAAARSIDKGEDR